MVNYISATAAVVIMMSVFSTFLAVAESTAEKVGEFSYQMEESMDCAVLGIPVERCVPSYVNLEEDSQEYQKLLNQTQKEMYLLAQEYNIELGYP